MKKHIFHVGLILTLLAFLLPHPARPASAAPHRLDPAEFVVNTTQDIQDANIGDGICAASNGACSLRAAIQEGYNYSLAPIRFNIPGTGPRIIYLLESILPHVYNDILGPNQDGAEIVIDGSNNGSPLSRGLYLYNDGLEVKGLTVQNFSRTAIAVAGNNAQVGGTTAQEANVLCNATYGIEDNIDTIGTHIYGNFSGVRKNGTTCPNTYGISISGQDTIIGGALTGQRNFISGNQSGILVSIYADNTSIKNNFIGLAATGTSVIPNSEYGIVIQKGLTDTQATNTVIGGTLANEGNYIAGNGLAAIRVNNGTIGTLIQGNFIGMNLSHSAHLPNGLGILVKSSGVTIGGSAAAANQTLDPIEINGLGESSYISNITVSDNYIGVTADYIYRLTSDLDGIKAIASLNNTIQRNYISHFTTGINIYPTATTGHQVIRNRIWGNTGLGIDLGNDGVTLNDEDDPDTGPNSYQNFPVITGFTNTSNVFITLNGTLNSLPNKSFNIFIYTNPTCDENGYGEGRYFLHNVVAVTNASGDATWTSNLITLNNLEGICFTAQAEETSLDDTSEFSQGFLAGWQIYLPMITR